MGGLPVSRCQERGLGAFAPLVADQSTGQAHDEIGQSSICCSLLGGGDKWVKSKTVIWTPPGLFMG